MLLIDNNATAWNSGSGLSMINFELFSECSKGKMSRTSAKKHEGFQASWSKRKDLAPWVSNLDP
jgi:hypothetical protein